MSQVLHSSEKAQFRKLFQREAIDKFEERFSILETFLRTERHVTLIDLLELLADRNIVFDTNFVDDTMSLMCRYGFARKHRFDSEPVRYEHMHLGQHHDHMFCVKCNSIFEFKDERFEQLRVEIAGRTGFHVLQHRIDLYGICSKCMTKCNKIACLADALQGEHLLIIDFVGGKKTVSRLVSVGLRIGDEIDVVVNSGSGPLVIAMGNRRLVLCRDFASNVLVKTKIEENMPGV